MLLLLLTAWGLALPGCSGCRKEQQTAKKEEDAKKKTKEKPDYEFNRLEVVPSDDSLTRNFVKPGHVATASLSAV